MTMYKMVNGLRVLMTPIEEQEMLLLLSNPPKPPLSDRLKAIFDSAFPQVTDLALKAHFRTIQSSVQTCLQENDKGSAKYIIQNAKQPNGSALPLSLITVQMALLAEFDK